MKYSLTKYQKTLCALAAACFVVWIATAAILGGLTDIGDKWPWTLAESIVFTVVLCFVIAFPARDRHKSFSERVERDYISLRRDLCCRLLLIENVFCFAMCITHMTGLTVDGTVIAKVGIIHLLGMIMMIVCAVCVVVFARKAKQLKFADAMAASREQGGR